MTDRGGFSYGLGCFLAGWLLAGNLTVLVAAIIVIAAIADYRAQRNEQARR